MLQTLPATSTEADTSSNLFEPDDFAPGVRAPVLESRQPGILGSTPALGIEYYGGWADISCSERHSYPPEPQPPLPAFLTHTMRGSQQEPDDETIISEGKLPVDRWSPSRGASLTFELLFSITLARASSVVSHGNAARTDEISPDREPSTVESR